MYNHKRCNVSRGLFWFCHRRIFIRTSSTSKSVKMDLKDWNIPKNYPWIGAHGS
uniref:Uncharacterized protein n=1 Tax=Arundo donax TaxID=35708 RepID=A0A0A8YDC8_ARUDO